MKIKILYTAFGIAVILVGWGMTWANQNAKINVNKTNIELLSATVKNVSSQATEADKAIVRMETKIEYILKGIDEIKAEVKRRNH